MMCTLSLHQIAFSSASVPFSFMEHLASAFRIKKLLCVSLSGLLACFHPQSKQRWDVSFMKRVFFWQNKDFKSRSWSTSSWFHQLLLAFLLEASGTGSWWRMRPRQQHSVLGRMSGSIDFEGDNWRLDTQWSLSTTPPPQMPWLRTLQEADEAFLRPSISEPLC